MKNWKDNLSFVLVEPREPGNIGASARAMKNMGFRDLCVVNPPPFTDEARWFARNAHDVLDSAVSFATLGDALRDRSVVVGATRRKGKNRGAFLSVEEGAKRIAELAQCNKVAILFGREDKGLLNEEVEECSLLLTIPTSDEQPSLNLGQAVLIVAYELSRVKYRESSSEEVRRLVDHGDLVALYARISRALELLGYMPAGNRDLGKAIMQNLKHFIGRAGITEWEMQMLHGICSQVEKVIKGEKEE
ncbi:MAG: RNA methyltransferase [Nitrospirales bacterium]|nr:RNA methyltransferase [Nitrospirales bacterium]